MPLSATIIAMATLAGAAYASSLSPGSAHVINLCTYDVKLCNVPAADGGYEQTDETLKAGESWSHPWTQLSNGNGWSIKLSKTDSLENILQYEYTWHNDGTIWYDLSCVNGNPWDKNWEITSSTLSCAPKQQAYRYSTDDAYGMQSCPQDASITVTLCSGEAGNNGTTPDDGSDSGSSSSSAAPAYSAPADSTSEEAAPAYTPPAVVTYGYNWNNADVSASINPDSSAVVTPTTFATQVTAAAAVNEDGVVVSQVETVYVTDVVTAYAAKPRAKRHTHHQRHQHGN